MASTSAEKTISVLRELFARLGIPAGHGQWPAIHFERVRSIHGVLGNQTFALSPYHPASNGAAERLVQTVKMAILAGQQSGASLEQSLAAFLLQYRNTPHATAGTTPSLLMFGRLLRPSVVLQVQDQQSRQKQAHDQHA